jgi:crossover junction endodeoxyribonuclease RuvC
MARGIVILTLADAGVPIIELTPNQVKQGITGWGAADKKQIQEMVRRLLNLKEIPKPDDAADALALAIVGGPLVALQATKKVSEQKN